MWRLFSHSTRQSYCVIRDSLSAPNKQLPSSCSSTMSRTRDSSATWCDALPFLRRMRSGPHDRSHAYDAVCEMSTRHPHCRCCTTSWNCCRSSSTCLDDSRTPAPLISLAMAMRSTFLFLYRLVAFVFCAFFLLFSKGIPLSALSRFTLDPSFGAENEFQLMRRRTAI